MAVRRKEIGEKDYAKEGERKRYLWSKVARVSDVTFYLRSKDVGVRAGKMLAGCFFCWLWVYL